MRTLAFVVALGLVALVGCSGDAPATTPDGGNACTKVLYDPCATEHDCTSGACHTFTPSAGSAIEVCTQSCATMACPADSTGAAGTCDAAMLCEPAKANACTLTL